MLGRNCLEKGDEGDSEGRSGGKEEKKRKKMRLGGRTFSQEKRTENDLFMTVDHFGSGGRRSDSRLGRRRKKLQESRNLGI